VRQNGCELRGFAFGYKAAAWSYLSVIIIPNTSGTPCNRGILGSEGPMTSRRTAHSAQRFAPSGRIMPFPWSGPAGSPVAEWVWCRRHAADVGLNRSAASGEGTTVRILDVRISGVCNDRVCDACSGCRLVGIGLVSSRFCRYGLSGPANGRVDCAS